MDDKKQYQELRKILGVTATRTEFATQLAALANTATDPQVKEYAERMTALLRASAAEGEDGQFNLRRYMSVMLHAGGIPPLRELGQLVAEVDRYSRAKASEVVESGGYGVIRPGWPAPSPSALGESDED